MPKYKLLINRERFPEIISSTGFRLFCLTCGFIGLIMLRIFTRAFGFSLGYLYVILISLTGLWFGLRGGLVAATVASLIFVAEIIIFRNWPFRNLVIQGMLLRLLVYLLGGVTLGYLSSIEKKMKERLKNLAYYDELTGCVNFRWTMQLLEREIARSKRYQKKMTIIMIDLDHFKEINDKFNHLVGNDILKAFANILKQSVRNIDVVGRYGGEEFLILLYETNASQALVVAERIRDKLSQAQITSPRLKEKTRFSLRFSAGIASFPQNGQSLEDLISVADSALYRAKRTGRNRTIAEKRKWVRLEPLTGLKIEFVQSLDEKGLEASGIVNISQRGMLLLIPKDISSGEFICKLRFPQEKLPSELKCKVVHKDRTKDDLYRVGVYFTDIPPDTREKLSQYIK